MGRLFKACVFLLAGLFFCAEVAAQTMYRCGNKYQDRPCDAGQKSKVMGAAGAGAAASSASSDAQCAQLGKDALKIVWSREGGATQERLVSEASTSQEKRLVADVYRRRGSAGEIQAAVTADCVEQKEKQERADALAAAAARAQKEAGVEPAAPAAAPRAYVESPEAAERRRQERAEQEAAARKRTCASLNSEMDSLRAQERSGGSTAAMERLSQQRRGIQDRMGGSGC
jgi:hypothetical protein